MDKFKKSGEKFFTGEALKAVMDKSLVYPWLGDNELFKGAFTGATEVKDGVREPVTTIDFLNRGKIAHFIQIVTAAHGVNAIQVPVVRNDETLESTFATIDIKMKDEKFTGDSGNFADMLLYKLISENSATPTLISPESGIIERMTSALELLHKRGKPPEKSAFLVDSNVYNELNIETGGGDEASKYWNVSKRGSTFMGLPIIEAPCAGTGDIYIINTFDILGVVRDSPISESNIRIGVGTTSDAVVVSADPNAHVISKHFDADTNDWCIDCWTCGYSHWASTEVEAREKLNTHAGHGVRLFYRK